VGGKGDELQGMIGNDHLERDIWCSFFDKDVLRDSPQEGRQRRRQGRTVTAALKEKIVRLKEV